MDFIKGERQRIVIIIIKLTKNRTDPESGESIPFWNRYIIIAKKLPKRIQ